jgi:hypothetical protein
MDEICGEFIHRVSTEQDIADVADDVAESARKRLEQNTADVAESARAAENARKRFNDIADDYQSLISLYFKDYPDMEIRYFKDPKMRFHSDFDMLFLHHIVGDEVSSDAMHPNLRIKPLFLNSMNRGEPYISWRSKIFHHLFQNGRMVDILDCVDGLLKEIHRAMTEYSNKGQQVDDYVRVLKSVEIKGNGMYAAIGRINQIEDAIRRSGSCRNPDKSWFSHIYIDKNRAEQSQ